MKKPLKTRYPLESFDPRFRNIWLRAVLNEVRIEFPTEREARAFQARLQLYRAALRDANPTDAASLYRAKTSLQGKLVLIRPTDAVHKDILDEFNKIPSGAASTEAPPAAPDLDDTTSKPLSLDDIFSDLNTEGEPQ